MEDAQRAEIKAAHDPDTHDTTLAGDVHIVTSPHSMEALRFWWCHTCSSAFSRKVASYTGIDWDTAGLGNARERERLERLTVAATLRELSGGSGIIPASAGRIELK